MPTTVGDEGGFAPNLPSNEAALQLIMEAIDKAGYTPGTTSRSRSTARQRVLQGRRVRPRRRRACRLTRAQFADYLAAWCDKYPIISIEDGMAEDDWDGWKILTDRLGKNVQLVGDDLFVTNTKILKQGIAKGVANSILIKINQIGTLSETFAAIEMAKRARLHRGHLAPLGRDRGHHHRRHRRRHQRAADQDRLAVALRPHRQVQPAAAHRGRPRRRGELPGPRGVLPARGRRRLRWLALAFVALIVALQYPLWLGKGGWLRVWELDRQLAAQQRRATRSSRRATTRSTPTCAT